ncbi:VOC family protein [Schlesneria sp. DSM 10557]|uniref:VOC family protein n=1 Tax=Schlesneria sp. DSM 10557 TaxID=3044399 RepID=UPI0035A01A3E
MTLPSVPAGRQTVSAYLVSRNALKALDYYRDVFGATEAYRLMMPDGRLGHAEFRIGNSTVMISDEFLEYGCKSPSTLGGSPITMHIYVDDVDAVFQKALDAGAKERTPVMDQFYGDRSGQIEDPFGHIWCIATHKQDISPEEMQRHIRESSGTNEPQNPS